MSHTLGSGLRVAAVFLVAFSATPVAQPAARPPINWREVRALKMGRFKAHIEVSSQHTLRLISELDTSYLVGPELGPDSTGDWQKTMFAQLGKPEKLRYFLGNALLVEPFAADSVTIGYLLTVADTAGSTRSVVTDQSGMEEFLDLVDRGIIAARTLSDEELRRKGPIVEKPIALARHVNFVYPRKAQLANISGSAVVQFVVDTVGKARPETIRCIEATYKEFAEAAVAAVKSMEFTPATLEGHKVEQLVQYPIDFKLNAVLPVKPFQVPTRRGRR
jgi:TonB family protein